MQQTPSRVAQKALKIMFAAILSAGVCASSFAASKTNIGHYGSPRHGKALLTAMAVTAKYDSNSFTLVNTTPYDVWFEIAGVTPDSPQLLKAAGSADGHDSYIVDNVTRDMATWVYSDYNFQQPKLVQEPTITPNRGYSATLYVFNNVGA